MNDFSGRNILMVIPKNQFCEEELLGSRSVLENAGARVVVLSKSGQEAVGMRKTRFKPDGMLIDWNRQEGIAEKYDAVLVIGGKGTRKWLWDDPILPQILNDHYRSGSVVGAIGSAVVVLARASFLTGEATGPDDELFLQEMEKAGAVWVDTPVTRCERIITARGAQAAEEFARTVLQALMDDEGMSN